MARKIPSVFGGNIATNAKTISEDYAGMAGCSQEQIWTPINIPKEPEEDSTLPGFRPPAQVEEVSDGNFDAGHVGPTNKELSPYFGLGVKTDFQVVMHNDQSTDLNVQRLDHEDLDSVRTMALRGPIILSGWGYDLADQPILESEDEEDNGENGIRADVATNRTLWKSGPIDLKWDDERQVWSGGPQIVEGILTSTISAPSSPDNPTEFTVSLRRGKNWEDKDEIITCFNRDTSLRVSSFEDVYVMAIRINYEWRPIWVGCP